MATHSRQIQRIAPRQFLKMIEARRNVLKRPRPPAAVVPHSSVFKRPRRNPLSPQQRAQMPAILQPALRFPLPAMYKYNDRHPLFIRKLR